MEVFCKEKFNWKFIDKTITTYSGDGISSVAFDKEYHKVQKELILRLFRDLPKKMIYHSLQHRMFNEIKFGNLVLGFRDFGFICFYTQSMAPYARDFGYWVKYRLFTKK